MVSWLRFERMMKDPQALAAAFPVVDKLICLAHAGVAPLCAAAAQAMVCYAQAGAGQCQESGSMHGIADHARRVAAQMLRCADDEIALLGPTTLGLNLVALGLSFQPGDQVIYYPDDYPANVYCWRALADRGVELVPLTPDFPGVISWPHIEQLVTDRTRLVALASCHYLSGFRIDVNTIGRHLQERGILFSLDAIQTLGTGPLDVTYVDFLSADSHKWLLGPMGAGIFYVKRSRFDLLKPALLGSWNVYSPDFVAQDDVHRFYPGARRYEPGTLNLPGIAGMAAGMEQLLALGLDNIYARLVKQRRLLIDLLYPMGYQLYLEQVDRDPITPATAWGGIVSFIHPKAKIQKIQAGLASLDVAVSFRRDRAGRWVLRLSPHFYVTDEQLHAFADLIRPITAKACPPPPKPRKAIKMPQADDPENPAGTAAPQQPDTPPNDPEQSDGSEE